MCWQVKELFELVKKQIEQFRSFNTVSPLTNFEIQKFYQNKPKYNGVYSKNNLPKIKNGVYVINLNEHKSIESHWIALCADDNSVTYFGSFRAEHIPEKIQ